MDIDEVEVAIEELENRLERLRALYEQYFLGIEKIEPSIARKDVDRRIWLLRREQIRNTAKRFKLQTVIQRYNTFQQYWGRICREIENGTYTRHLIRAQKNQGAELLTIAARKRLGRRRKQEGDEEQPGERAWEVEKELGDALENPDWKPLEDAKRAVDEVLGRDSSSAPPREAPSRPGPGAAPASTWARPRPAADLGRLDLEMDFFDAPTQPASSRPVLEAKPRPAALAAARAAAAGKPLSSRPAAASPVKPAVPAAARPAQPAAPRSAPAAAARPIPPAGARPPAAQPQRPAAQAAHPAAAARPAAPAPPRQPPAAPARPAPAARPPAAAAGGDEPRLRDLHARLVEAKRRTNDTRQVSVDGLRKSLEAAESRLRQQHGNRKIDFDVVIKDGKAVVKPILR